MSAVSKVDDAPDVPPGDADAPDYDYLIVGAGVCGLYQLYRLLGIGVRVAALEANEGVGGTWYKNRYPGCRFDSESYTYAYSFSKELLQEWDWSERFASRPETLQYLNYFADKFNLLPHIFFGARVTQATFEATSNLWTVALQDGRSFTTRFLITAIGLLSNPTLPRLEGIDSFQGDSFHTYDWPADGIDLVGKRVAVVGTGATGVQLISAIAGEVGHLTVFQRNPNWCVPLGNGPLTREEMANVKGTYAEIFERCHQSPSGFIHQPDPRLTFEVPFEERIAFWEELYASPGFGIWLGNFKDTLLDETANAELSSFVAAKIRERVRSDLAEKFIPQDHGFGTKRVAMDTGYYEVYGRPNVDLVSLSETPIERVTPSGIRTSAQDFDFDVIVYATGFDAVTGPFDRIVFSGTDGETLQEKWANGPITAMGLQTAGFPNLFFLAGPQAASAASNFPRGIEEMVDWMTEFATHVRDNQYTRVEVSPEAEEEWVEHVTAVNRRVLFGNSKSWFTGYNSNLDRDENPRQMIYAGGAIKYRKKLAAETNGGYPSFIFNFSE